MAWCVSILAAARAGCCARRMALQADEFNFNAHYRGRDGTLYFGGNGGFNAFLPEVALSDAPPPHLALTSVAILNEQLPFPQLPRAGRPLALAHDDKLVTFEFAALDFMSPASNRYLYRLEGFDPNWVNAGPLHRATYTNLDAGEYLLPRTRDECRRRLERSGPDDSCARRSGALEYVDGAPDVRGSCLVDPRLSVEAATCATCA